MAKRRPGTELNHENWDVEEQPEKSGEFRMANDEELKNRVRKVARRRMNVSTAKNSLAPINDSSIVDTTNDEEPQKPSVFSGFGGFTGLTKTNPSKLAASPFAFLSNVKITNPAQTTDTNTATTKSAIKTTESSIKTTESSIKTTESISSNVTGSTTDKSDYYAKLKGLNESVAEWISKHVNENPLCILTPIFDDYAKHLGNVQKEFKKDTNKSKTASSNLSFGFGVPNTGSDLNKKSSFLSTTSTFSFGGNSSITSGPSSFSSNSLPTKGFSFTSGQQPFTFKIAPSPASNEELKSTTNETANDASSKNNDDEDDQPPKVEFTQVIEDDSLYSKRCKIYVKSDTGFKERGVGMLYIKSVGSGGDEKKIQLLVRADTNLGNILLNILLTEAVPAKRMGKNDVMLMCLPTPDAKPPPAAVLIRVKTSVDADDLLKQIDKYKQIDK